MVSAPPLTSPDDLLAWYPPAMQALAHELRRIVMRALPESIEHVRTGWRVIGYDIPRAGRKKPALYAYVWAERKHVHLGFHHGVLMHDPERRLEGRGITKRVRWLTFVEPHEIDEAELRPLILESADLARLSHRERLGLLLGRPDSS